MTTIQKARKRHEIQKRYYEKKMSTSEGRKEVAELAARWRAKNPEKARAIKLKQYHEHKEEIARKHHEENQRLKIEALKHYSNGNLACAMCHESRLACLSLDHINNDGYNHRKEVGNGTKLYRWLRQHDYPSELRLQVLCMNCQFIKKHSGVLWILPTEQRVKRQYRKRL